MRPSWKIRVWPFSLLPCSGKLTAVVVELDNKIEDMDEEEEEEAATAKATPTSETNESSEDAALDASFMSESIYQKLPTTSPRGRKVRSISAHCP